MGRRFIFVLGLVFVLGGISGLSWYRLVEVENGTILSLDALFSDLYAGSILIGVCLALYAAYSKAWIGWDRIKKTRAIVLGGALFLFSLSAADILTVWTAGMNLNQGLIGANTTLIEGINFREWVTELGGGALLAVLGLLLDLAE